MTLYLLIGFVLVILNAVLSIFGQVAVLPWGMDAPMVQYFGMWNTLMDRDLWLLQAPFHAFQFFLIFLGIVLLARFFFGSRLDIR